MDALLLADARLRTARDGLYHDLDAQVARLEREHATLVERLDRLNDKKLQTAQENGDVDADDEDLIEINAGGKIVAAKRCTLTRLAGTRFEALFSGRWDKQLQRDGHGRIFVDVNPVCFRAIVDYLHELAISSPDNTPDPPSVDEEHKDILERQIELFGLLDQLHVKMPWSHILDAGQAAQLHAWLGDGDGKLGLLYRSSVHGMTNTSFHAQCDGAGSTLTVIETTEGYLVGGYANTSWTSNDGHRSAERAFLFVLAGPDVAAPRRMKLKNAEGTKAVWHVARYGPIFGEGHDLFVNGSAVHLNLGHTYEEGPSGRLTSRDNGVPSFTIKEMEVFRVDEKSPHAATPAGGATRSNIANAEPVDRFTQDINEAINAKQTSLVQAESEIRHLEECFTDERHFVTAFAHGATKDVIVLNVSGTEMATKRSTLQAVEESVLAQQFDDTKWTEHGCNGIPAQEWTADDVCAWVRGIDGIPDDVASVFRENGITGPELLALGIGGLKEIGVKRAGTVYLLLDEIRKVQSVTLIEHSPYCFGKILDFLRWRQLSSQGLAEEPTVPVVCDAQKKRFRKVARYYFPGDSAKLLLGDGRAANQEMVQSDVDLDREY